MIYVSKTISLKQDFKLNSSFSTTSALKIDNNDNNVNTQTNMDHSQVKTEMDSLTNKLEVSYNNLNEAHETQAAASRRVVVGIKEHNNLLGDLPLDTSSFSWTQPILDNMKRRINELTVQHNQLDSGNMRDDVQALDIMKEKMEIHMTRLNMYKMETDSVRSLLTAEQRARIQDSLNTVQEAKSVFDTHAEKEKFHLSEWFDINKQITELKRTQGSLDANLNSHNSQMGSSSSNSRSGPGSGPNSGSTSGPSTSGGGGGNSGITGGSSSNARTLDTKFLSSSDYINYPYNSGYMYETNDTFVVKLLHTIHEIIEALIGS